MRQEISVLVAANVEDGTNFRANHSHIPDDAVIVTPRTLWNKTVFGRRATSIFYTELAERDASNEADKLRRALNTSQRVKSDV